ncbi:protein phosphatase 1 regulatory subunit 12B-like [Mastacembelus armatus]|uniref:Protein phosphatase 1 regulatory subunit 12B-like n=1 Tax=Mastacembelus armatus TaxID=205130 RepID=A0A3Q3LA29_9TELE|nr:protein phosphatase 1 regulatory subunit 12B-like [Mastacembelus armatus]XP_026163436.1 protein phosphatase 1 regulatory subunit 12B-like [Mastacembelus armatus]
MSSLLSHNKDQPHIKKSLSDSSPTLSTATTKSQGLDRLSRLSSSEGPHDTSTNHAESYFLRRENRLSARKKAEEEPQNNDYKKMYEKALATNQRFKSRLETSKQELSILQDQLQRVQKGKPGNYRTNMLATEKEASWSLKKKITDMEEQLKVKAELKMENQRLKDENGALIRVITKLSK